MGKTPLVCSLFNGQADMTRALLEAGCSLVGARQWLTSDDPAAAEVRQQYIDEGHRDVIDYVENTPATVQSLMSLCRRALRAQVSRHDIEQLPLPTVLKNYLRM